MSETTAAVNRVNEELYRTNAELLLLIETVEATNIELVLVIETVEATNLPRIDGSISDQSRCDATNTVLDVRLLQRQRCGVVEQATVEPVDRLEADPAARGHHPEERSPARSAKCAGVRRACSSIRVNMWPGSKPTSSANIQKTSRLTKCATARGS